MQKFDKIWCTMSGLWFGAGFCLEFGLGHFSCSFSRISQLQYGNEELSKNTVISREDLGNLPL